MFLLRQSRPLAALMTLTPLLMAELEYEAKGMGTGAVFQRTMEALLEKARGDKSGGIHAEPSA